METPANIHPYKSKPDLTPFFIPKVIVASDLGATGCPTFPIMLDSVEKCSEPRMASRVREKQVARLSLSEFRDAWLASGAIHTGSSPAAEGDKRGLDVIERNIMSSEPTAGDKRKRRVPDAGGFHTDEDGLEASSNLHTRPRRLLQDELDLAMLEEEIAPFMSFPSLREILAGNSETKGPAQSVCLTKPEQDALMM